MILAIFVRIRAKKGLKSAFLEGNYVLLVNNFFLRSLFKVFEFWDKILKAETKALFLWTYAREVDFWGVMVKFPTDY